MLLSMFLFMFDTSKGKIKITISLLLFSFAINENSYNQWNFLMYLNESKVLKDSVTILDFSLYT